MRKQQPRENSVLRIDPLPDNNTWLCPFCRRLNGVAERPVCNCGAIKLGNIAELHSKDDPL